MPRRWRAILTLALGISAEACRSVPPVMPFSGRVDAYHEGARVAVAGDLQRTSWLEFWREQNDAERAKVVAAIVDLRPALLALTGDLVFDGGSLAEWAAFDALAAPIRAAGIPVFPALGNHEYWGGRDGTIQLFLRFQHLGGDRWYRLAFGPLALVFLDSNIGELSAEAWEKQRRWYEATLGELDADPAVKGVIVLCHHPPYTNSTVTGDEEHVARWFVPPFLRAKKTLAMMNGHVHSYERFARGPKAFITSGGGGGPRARLATGARRRHPDDLFPGPAIRSFNFVVFTVTRAGLEAEVMGLPKGGDAFSVMDRFALPWSLSR